MKKKYYGKIKFTIDKEHPDIKYVHDWTKNKEFEFDDTYTFNKSFYEEDDCIRYIKRDLRLIAGGGYNSDHIHNVSFEIRKL